MRNARQIATAFDTITAALSDILLALAELRDEFDPRWHRRTEPKRQPRRKRTRKKN